LSLESAAVDFVRDAFGHLKAIAADQGAKALLKIANIGDDAGVVSANNETAFMAAAKTRQWAGKNPYGRWPKAGVSLPAARERMHLDKKSSLSWAYTRWKA
jgi:hypothetical protein